MAIRNDTTWRMTLGLDGQKGGKGAKGEKGDRAALPAGGQTVEVAEVTLLMAFMP